MGRSEKPPNIIWARWLVREDDTVDVVATYAEGKEYREWKATYASLADAATELGPSFEDVVGRSVALGSRQGRWRP